MSKMHLDSTKPALATSQKIFLTLLRWKQTFIFERRAKQRKEPTYYYTHIVFPESSSEELGGIKIGEYIKCPPPFYSYISRQIEF